MKLNNKLMCVLAFGALGLTATGASAQTTTASATLAINANVASSCSISLTQPGTISGPPGSAVAVSAQVGINCTNGTPFTVSFGNGGNFDGTNRRLKHTDATITTNNFIPYSFSGDQATATTPAFPSRGTGALVNTAVWIRAIIPSDVRVGSYSDNVQVSVSY